ncbi:UNVERIFIED_CONTAM: hypothetical protein GTU68_041019 [Idotea baltica]|nr:hypothetical protein [Idotea baltica]
MSIYSERPFIIMS